MDPVHFTGKEVIEMAIKIEENGEKFYSDAGKASKSKEIKELFKSLASDEVEHIRVFTNLKKLIPDDSPSEGFDPYIEEANLYLRAFADTEVFKSPKEGKKLATTVHDEKEALEVASGMEKDSLLFYYELLKMIREKDRIVVEKIIEQEKEHLRKVTELQRSLYGK